MKWNIPLKKIGKQHDEMAETVFTRRPNASLRKPRSFPPACIHGVTRQNVNIYFSILEQAIFHANFSPNRNVTVYDKVMATVLHTTSECIRLKAKENKPQVCHQLRGMFCYIHECFLSTGATLHYYLQEEYEITDTRWGTPWHGFCHVSVSIKADSFVQWFRQLTSLVKPTTYVLPTHAVSNYTTGFSSVSLQLFVQWFN
jgi:hypothetical protein